MIFESAKFEDGDTEQLTYKVRPKHKRHVRWRLGGFFGMAGTLDFYVMFLEGKMGDVWKSWWFMWGDFWDGWISRKCFWKKEMGDIGGGLAQMN